VFYRVIPYRLSTVVILARLDQDRSSNNNNNKNNNVTTGGDHYPSFYFNYFSGVGATKQTEQLPTAFDERTAHAAAGAVAAHASQ